MSTEKRDIELVREWQEAKRVDCPCFECLAEFVHRVRAEGRAEAFTAMRDVMMLRGLAHATCVDWISEAERDLKGGDHGE